MSEQTVFDINISPDYPSDVFIVWAGKQNYSNVNASKTWQLNLYYDEVLVNYAGGSAGITDSPVITASITKTSAASHRVRLSWDSDSSIQLKGGNGEIVMLKK